MPYNHVYTLRHQATVSTAISVLQLAAGALCPFEILSASANQRGSTVSVQEKISFVRKTGAATVTTAVVGTHLFKTKTGDPTPSLQLGTALTGVIGTAEGTDGDNLLEEGFNVLNGWVYLPVPEERIFVPAAGIIALKFLVAPASQAWDFRVTVRELGT